MTREENASYPKTTFEKCKIKDLDIMCSIDCLLEKPIVLYGATWWSWQVKEWLEMAFATKVEILAVADDEKKRIRRKFFGLQIIGNDELCEKCSANDVLIISDNEKAEKAVELLSSHGLFKTVISTVYAVGKSIYYNYQDSRVSDKMKDKVEYYDLCQRLTRRQVEELVSGLKPWDIRYSVPDHMIMLLTTNKVGSMSLYHELKARERECVHVHDLYSYFWINHIDEKDYMRWFDYLKKSKIKLVAGVREPISRDFSKFFQLDSVLLMNEFSHEKTIKERCLDFLKSQTMCGGTFFDEDYYTYNNYWEKNLQYGAEFDFFDLEIKRAFGIDIFEKPFDKAKGYTVYQQGDMTLLVYRLEDFKKLESVFADFFGCPGFCIRSENAAADKMYRHAYNAMKEQISLPPEYIEFYYKNNPRMDYFYSKEEQQAFLKKWL